MPSKKHVRTRDRSNAVQVLYTSELQSKPASQLIDEGQCLLEDGTLTDYALQLIRGVEEHGDAIDERLEAASENWTLARMPIVDRSILRLAAFEMLHVDDVPVSVSINEAVELAKDFGGEEDSPRFVNGVLGRIARQLEADAADAGDASSSAIPSERSESKDLGYGAQVPETVAASAAAAVVQEEV